MNLLIRKGGRGADFDVVEVWDTGRDDGVEAREDGKVVRRVRADVIEGGIRGDVVGANESGIVGTIDELSKERSFIGREVEALEVVQLGRDSDDEFLREDKFQALRRLDEDFDSVVVASVGGNDAALQQDIIWSECRESFVVNLAVVLAGRCQESALQAL